MKKTIRTTLVTTVVAAGVLILGTLGVKARAYMAADAPLAVGHRRAQLSRCLRRPMLPSACRITRASMSCSTSTPRI